MYIEPGSKLLMIGDSVTDCGRARPIGEGHDDEYGYGYVSFVHASLTAVYPERRIRVVNMGISGNTVRDLKARWKTDVLDLKPDWLTIMIGINDVWRQFDAPLQKECHVYLDEYTETLDELVAKTKPSLKGLVLMTPFYMEPNKEDAMRSMMDKYGEAVRNIASRHNTLFVDTQAAFDKILGHYHSNMFARDRVHPNHPGHMVIARALLKALNF
jgi:lysophospholipase L1-like esterase